MGCGDAVMRLYGDAGMQGYEDGGMPEFVLSAMGCGCDGFNPPNNEL